VLSITNPVLAHLPHDEVYFVATPEDGSDKGPWLSSHYNAAALSSDGGGQWQNIGGEVFLYGGHEGFTLADGTIVVCGDEALWQTTDLGKSWSEISINSGIRDCAMHGNEIVIASNKGLLFGEYDGLLTTLADGRYASVDWSGDWISAVGGNDDAIYYGRSGEKGSVILGPNENLGATTMMSNPDVLFVGDLDGDVWTLKSGVWTLCANIPPMERSGVLHMSAFEDSLLVLPASKGPYMTNRECSAWEDRSIPVITAFMPTGGGAINGKAAFTTMRLGEEAWIIAGWAGIYTSEDQGVSWKQSWLGATDRTMGVAYHSDFPDNPRIWMATYASGVAYTDDLGETFQSQSFDLSFGNIQYVNSVPAMDSLVFATDNWDLFSSIDAGVTWAAHDDPFGQLFDIQAFAADDIWLVTKYSEGTYPTRAVYSSDGGNIWTDVYVDKSILDVYSSVVRFPVGDGDRYCMADDKGVACTDDRDGDWDLKHSFSYDARNRGFAVWPGKVAPVVVCSTTGALYSTTDLGENWELSFAAGDDEIVDVAVSPQGVGLALTRMGSLLTSDDGLNWTETSIKIEAWGYSINFRPDAAGPTEALLGTSSGVVRLALKDGVWSAEPFGIYQCIDSASTYSECDDCAEESHKDAWMSHAYRVGPGAEIELHIQGSSIKVRGASDVDSMALVALEKLGLEYEIGGIDSDGFGELLIIDDLEDQTHLVTITHLAGDGVLFDALEGYGPGVTLSSEKPVVTETAETGTSHSEETSSPNETGVADTGSPNSCGCNYWTATSTLVWTGLLIPVLLMRRETTKTSYS
jgi:photosystem II stability/assembly factor-like uncharacterized protein